MNNRLARFAGVVIASAGIFAGGYAAGNSGAHVTHVTACPSPALPGQHAGYVISGSRIIGVDGSNGLGAGDVYTCVNGQGSVN